MTIGAWLENRLVRRAIFVGATLLPVAVIWSAVVLPVHDYLSARDIEIAKRSEMLARLKGIAAYEQKLEEPADTADGKEEYLTGPNEGVATAMLQVRLKAFAQSNGARLKSVQGLPAETEGELQFIGARLDIAGPLRAIHQTIFALENAKPYLFVRNAAVKLARQARNPAGRPAEPIIEAQLEVFGAFRAEAGP